MDKKHTLITLSNVVPRLSALQFRQPLNWTIHRDEHWAVVGHNGSGKTLIGDLLQQKHALKEGEITSSATVRSIAFKDIHSLSDTRQGYYQQRWHSAENDDVPTVAGILQKQAGSEVYPELLRLFGIDNLLDKKINYLSSGELRKFLIVRILASRPEILILDNPFIGLDLASRNTLNELLSQLAISGQVHIVLLLSDPGDIPGMITHILPVDKMDCSSPQPIDQYKAGRYPPTSYTYTGSPVLPPPTHTSSSHTTTLRMEKICVKYGNRTILEHLDWEINNGEKWALLGPNGAGKSTLLSLVYADNPQSYANTFYLFDRKRGSGESIWDIKKHIGYVSPEMHIYFNENVSGIEIVGSGFFDSVGLYRKCDETQLSAARQWMQTFSITHLTERPFPTLSSGEQRLLLLARAFVKDPLLLILDEPLHGLDPQNKLLVKKIIEKFCKQQGKSLIYVTHYPEEIPVCVTRRFTLNQQK